MDRFSKRVNYSLRIENAFLFLINTYRGLGNIKFDKIKLDEINTIEEVYLTCLCEAVNILNKRGLYKEYIRRENIELISPKGSIDINKSITSQSSSRGKLVCSYYELSDNVLHNQIVKSTLHNMIYGNNISKETILKIQKAMQSFNGIEEVDLKSININKIKYNNSNLRYKSILNICNTLIELNKLSKIVEIKFEDKLYITFKNQLLAYYKKRYSNDFNISTKLIRQNENENKLEQLVYKQRRLVVIKTDKKALLIDCDMFDTYMSANEEEQKFNILKNAAVEYNEEYKINVVCGFIHCNTTDGYRETDIKIVNVDGIVLGYTVMDMNIKNKFIEFKLEQFIKLLLVDNK